VFDGAYIDRDEVVKVEVFNQGMFQDELLFYAYLELQYCANLDNSLPLQQQLSSSSSSGVLKATGLQPTTWRQGVPRPSNASLSDEEFVAIREEEEQQEGRQAGSSASLAASRRSSDGGGWQQPGARMSEVTTQGLALLSASKSTGSSSSGVLSAVGSSSMAGFGGRGKTLAKMRLKRSTHVRSAADLVVSVWWVLHPALQDTGGRDIPALWGDVSWGKGGGEREEGGGASLLWGATSNRHGTLLLWQ